jgi:nitroreductase
MKVFDAIKSNIAVRKFTTQILDDQQILQILEAARLCQSGKNLQPWFFIVIRNQRTLNLLADLMKGDADEVTVRNARVVIALIGDPESDSCLFDIGRATQNMTLAAWELGIGSCIMSGPEPPYREAYTKKAMDLLGIPKNLLFVSLLVFGMPRKTSHFPTKNRKDLLKIAFSETFGQPFRALHKVRSFLYHLIPFHATYPLTKVAA